MSGNYPNRFKDVVTIGGDPFSADNPGETFWVNNSTVLAKGGSGGSNGNPGTYKLPFETIEGAINSGKFLANRGDRMRVMPNHSEDISAAAGIDVDVDGIHIIGLSDGDAQATVTFSNTAATFEINCDNWRVEGINFEATVTGVLVGVDIVDGADDGALVGNRFSAETLGTDEFIDAVSITTSDRVDILGNSFDMDEAGADSAIHYDGICLGGTVSGNYVTGDYAVACIESITAAQEQLVITENTLINGAHSGLNTLPCVVLLTGTSGIFQNNQLYTNVVGAVTAAVAADGLFFGGGNFVQTSAETAPIALEGGASVIVRSSVATGKADETDALALFTVAGGNVFVHGVTQRAEVVANSAVLLGVQVNATDATLDSVLVTDTNLSTETTIGDYAVSTAAGGAFTVVQVETTTTSVMWNTPVTVPVGSIEQAASGTPGTLVSGYIIYWSEATAGATLVAA